MKKIIIADNVTALLEEQKNALSRATCRIFTATSNDEALALHRAEKANLIITKLDMPGLNGDDLCKAVRHDSELTGVSILLVCLGTDEDVARCRSCGANGYLPAPLTIDRLEKAAAKLIDIQERKAFRVIVSVGVEGSSDGRSFFCTLVNISVTGMMIEAANTLHEGDLVNASFFLHGRGKIKVQGKVVRARAKAVDLFEYGIHFVVPPLEVRSAIEGFVEEKRRAG